MSTIALTCLWLSGSALAATPDAGSELPLPSVPSAIAAPATQRVAFTFFAKGTQNYRCASQADAGFGWAFVGPEANLYATASEGAPVAGTHFAGPSWKLSKDNSTIVGDGANAQRANAPDPAAAVPWLLIPKKSAEGAGAFSRVTFVQRVETVGGVAPPAASCTTSNDGTVQKVPYTARYHFYVPR
jgi:Protein of unknown function (DUF3455)